jgi:glyoxylase-like metal-dependent hydrolase (beta-lactamase superfamily II)
MKVIVVLLLAIVLLAIVGALPLAAQKPEWCRDLPRPAYRALQRVSVPDTWFEVYKIRPGVFAIYEPHQSEEIISYLILGSKHALLFDTGMGISNIRATVEHLTTLPVSVLNSHTHNDHIGDNWRFQDIYGIDTYFTRANARGSRDDAQAEITAGQICGPLPQHFNAKEYSSRPFSITHWLHDGDTIDLGGRILQVIATPGHTPDSISLLDAAHGLLFTGDTYYPGPIFLYRPETNLADYTRSVEKLAAMAPRLQLLLPAHNVPVAAPADLARVVAAMRQVQSGQAHGTLRKDGRQEYAFDGFSFLLRK